MNYLICYSGGHSSALAAIEIYRNLSKEYSEEYARTHMILLNHDISSKVEHHDIKRFKYEVAKYLGIPITYANHPDFENMTPLKIAMQLGGFQFSAGKALCTYNLKTKPFYEYLEQHCQDKENYTIVYGFDATEENRIYRRRTLLRSMGYESEYPLANANRSIHSTLEIGIEPPISYRIYKHANCQGCLKAGIRNWYITFCLRKDIFEEALKAEEEIGYSIIKGHFLKDLVPRFLDMQEKGICPSDKGDNQSFWKRVDNAFPGEISLLPCDCALL